MGEHLRSMLKAPATKKLKFKKSVEKGKVDWEKAGSHDQ